MKTVLDTREHVSPGWKFNHWELKGVPIRIEVGPKELQASKFVACRRDTLQKTTYEVSDFVKVCRDTLDEIQQNLLNKARNVLDNNVAVVENWGDFTKELDCGKVFLFLILIHCFSC